MSLCTRLRAVTVVALGVAAVAFPANATRTKLRTLPRRDLAALAPLLEQGELVLIESDGKGFLRQATLLSLADASASRVLATVADPEGYPRFIPNLQQADRVRGDGVLSDVEWELEVPFVNLSGVLRFLDDRPRGVDYWPVKGNIKEGAWRWEAVDVEGGRSVVAQYTYANVRTASWFLEKLIAIRPTFEHGAVVATGIVVLKAICAESSRLAGRGDSRPHALRGRSRIRLDSISARVAGRGGRALLPLLTRGEVALVQSRPDGTFRQAVLMSMIDVPHDAVFQVARDVDHYPEFMPSIEGIDVLERTDTKIRYVNHLAIPVISFSVITEMVLAKQRIQLRIVGGDLKRGKYAWEFLPLDGGRKTLLLFYANTDVRSQSWFVKAMVEKEPYFEHGLNVGMGLVSIRAVKQRAEAMAR